MSIILFSQQPSIYLSGGNIAFFRWWEEKLVGFVVCLSAVNFGKRWNLQYYDFLINTFEFVPVSE